jgi:hypothetical protein
MQAARHRNILIERIKPMKTLKFKTESNQRRKKPFNEWLLLAFLLFWGDASIPAQQGLFESLYILKMTALVRYPAEQMQGEYLIGVVGSPDIAAQLDRSLTGKKVGEQFIKVRLFDEIAGLNSCHIIFLPDQYSKKLQRVLEAVRGKPVLIITKGAGMAREGSHISILATGEKKFEINKKAAEASGLRLNEDLLRLATVIDGGVQ